ncbi:MAG: efflux RND transporter periplasmic adaptor subunit [Phycisphaerae bacterium]|nr:efflux RND transporter periplasmic adaptor subunit [Phycisphaerae bacterium]
MKSDKLMGLTVRYILPAVIVIAGLLISTGLMKTKPKSVRRPPEKQARLVETVLIQPKDVTITVDGMGVVVPARQVNLTPQVSGKITELNPKLIPGVILAKDEKLLQIEPNDYELIVKQREGELANAQSNLEIEYGSQDVAKQESKLLGNTLSDSDKRLVLRQPHLGIAKSNFEMAQARLDQARLNLERTTIKLPFNAVINEKHIERGQMVSPSTPLVKLTGTDEFWINVSVQVDKLKWIKIPGKNGEEGSMVKVYNSSAWGENMFRTGKVVRLLPDLETSGRMAKLIVSIEDPLLIKSENPVRNLLLLGSYVRVEIEGETIKSAYSIDRSLLRNGDNVWVASNEGNETRLNIQSVNVLYKGKDEVVISNGIALSDNIVASDISAPVAGMQLRTSGQKENLAVKEKTQKP